jgi:ABC-type uncharacterized transport system permease subunit
MANFLQNYVFYIGVILCIIISITVIIFTIVTLIQPKIKEYVDKLPDGYVFKQIFKKLFNETDIIQQTRDYTALVIIAGIIILLIFSIVTSSKCN